MRQTHKAQTLVEVVVAAMISAATTMAVFSVIVSSFASQRKADKREAAGFMFKQAQEVLKSYVSAVPDDSNYSPCRVGCPGGLAGRWPADLSNKWALEAGNHNITPLLTGTHLIDNLMPAPAPAPSFTYTVENINCLKTATSLGVAPTDTNQCKKVTFSLTYQDQ